MVGAIGLLVSPAPGAGRPWTNGTFNLRQDNGFRVETDLSGDSDDGTATAIATNGSRTAEGSRGRHLGGTVNPREPLGRRHLSRLYRLVGPSDDVYGIALAATDPGSRRRCCDKAMRRSPGGPLLDRRVDKERLRGDSGGPLHRQRARPLLRQNWDDPECGAGRCRDRASRAGWPPPRRLHFPVLVGSVARWLHRRHVATAVVDHAAVRPSDRPRNQGLGGFAPHDARRP